MRLEWYIRTIKLREYPNHSLIKDMANEVAGNTPNTAFTLGLLVRFMDGLDCFLGAVNICGGGLLLCGVMDRESASLSQVAVSLWMNNG